MEPDFEILKQIKQVDASPFLLTRIRQKLEEKVRSSVSPALAYSIIAMVVVIFTIDIIVVKKHKNESKGNIAESLSLMPTNQIY